MKFSESDMTEIKDWIEKHAGGFGNKFSCQLCNSTSWTIHNTAVISIGIDIKSTRFFYQQGIPHVLVECTTCGQQVFINPKKIGL